MRFFDSNTQINTQIAQNLPIFFAKHSFWSIAFLISDRISEEKEISFPSFWEKQTKKKKRSYFLLSSPKYRTGSVPSVRYLPLSIFFGSGYRNVSLSFLRPSCFRKRLGGINKFFLLRSGQIYFYFPTVQLISASADSTFCSVVCQPDTSSLWVLCCSCECLVYTVHSTL